MILVQVVFNNFLLNKHNPDLINKALTDYAFRKGVNIWTIPLKN